MLLTCMCICATQVAQVFDHDQVQFSLDGEFWGTLLYIIGVFTNFLDEEEWSQSTLNVIMK